MTSVFETQVSPFSENKLKEAKIFRHQGEDVLSYLALETASLSYNPEAKYLLGLCYKDGKGVPADEKIAAHWFLLAAEEGEPAAQHLLGLMIYQGKIFSQNKQDGITWIQKAAFSGNQEAKKWLQTYSKAK